MSSRVVLLDVEGTTTPLAFVARTLFPFARAHLAGFIGSATGEGLEALAALDAERRAAGAPAAATAGERADALLRFALDLMDQDRKSPALKWVQGLIWKNGYRDGALRGEVFADVAPALRRIKAEGRRACIYSSGSVLAQQLLFSTTPDGDLTPWLEHHFDTAVGPKGAADSYRGIARTLGIAPGEGCFASDVVAELDAARTAGWRTCLMLRPGNAPVAPGHGHPTASDLGAL